MSTLKANIIDSSVSTEFKKSITANGAAQWLDTFGVIKANRNTIAEDVTIPSDTMVFHQDLSPLQMETLLQSMVSGQLYDKDNCQFS